MIMFLFMTKFSIIFTYLYHFTEAFWYNIFIFHLYEQVFLKFSFNIELIQKIALLFR